MYMHTHACTVQKRAKTESASAAKNAPMGKQKQIIDNLKKKLNEAKKQIVVRSEWMMGGWLVASVSLE